MSTHQELSIDPFAHDAVRRRRGLLRAALATARPKQWVKNALVIAAPAAAGALGHKGVPVRVGLAFASFCMLAAGIYAINDVRDAEEDRSHPSKRHRPVASGEISPRTALVAGAGSLIAGLSLCTAIRPLLGLVGLGYVVLTVSYTLAWRHVVVLDVIAVAGGFVLRAVAGGVAAPVALSRWFLLVVTFAAIMVAAGKRHAELQRTSERDLPKRRVLRSYSGRGLELILLGAAAGALIAYVMWVLELPVVGGIPWRPLSAIPFAGALLAYGRLVRDGGGEAPEDLFLTDGGLRVMAVFWLLLFALGVDAAG